MMLKKTSILFFTVIFLVIFFEVTTCDSNGSKYVRGCKGYGFFAEFLWVLNHLDYCVTRGFTPVVFWGEQSSYFPHHGPKDLNMWDYFFEPVSSLRYIQGDKLALDHYYRDDFSVIWNYPQYIQLLNFSESSTRKSFVKIFNKFPPMNHVYPFGKQHLYDYAFRKMIKSQLIDKFIKVKQPIVQKCDEFYNKYIKGISTIGIHLRGRWIHGEMPEITVEQIARLANELANNDTQFFVATDQVALIQQAKIYLKGKVIYYETQRSNAPTSPFPGKKLHPKLGEDLLIETLLLSKCNYFIHTISNVSTVVLYFNPDLPHRVLY